jgi:heat shock protein HtpX
MYVRRSVYLRADISHYPGTRRDMPLPITRINQAVFHGKAVNMINLLRTGLLLAVLTALFMAVGYWVAGPQGTIVALLAAGAINLVTYWKADVVVLRLYGAQEVDEIRAPDLWRLVRDLVARAHLPMPRVYIINNEQPNAFATGRNPEHAAIAVTTGLRQLPQSELAGVLAHELAHIRNRDTLTMTITATLAGAIGMLANLLFLFAPGRSDERNNGVSALAGLLIMLLAPLTAMLVQMAISRTRELAADRTGAEIIGQPISLANALARIHEIARHIPNDDAERNPATAHLFIINPLSGRHLDSLFSTHPPVEERIARLNAMMQTRPPFE